MVTLGRSNFLSLILTRCIPGRQELGGKEFPTTTTFISLQTLPDWFDAQRMYLCVSAGVSTFCPVPSSLSSAPSSSNLTALAALTVHVRVTLSPDVIVMGLLR